MAPPRKQRSAPQDDPLSASSDDDDSTQEEEEEEEQQQQQNTQPAPHKPEEGSEEESGEESAEESGEEEEEEAPPPAQQPPVQIPDPSGSLTDEGSESGSDSESQLFEVRPIATKPMMEGSSAKPSSKPGPVSKPGPKRPAEAQRNGKDTDAKKGKISNGNDESNEKKSAVSRLWSDTDELVVLKGMIDYQTKKRSDPYADMGAFYEFIKGQLHVDISKSQLTEKIRRLKKKYLNNADKGEDPVFSRPHELKSFQLSKKIWGVGTSNNEVASGNRKAKSSGEVGNSVTGVVKEGTMDIVMREALEENVKVDKDAFSAKYPYLVGSLQSDKHASLTMPSSFVKENISLIGSTKAEELDKKWKNLVQKEVGLYARRVDLIQEQLKLVNATEMKTKVNSSK